MRLLINKETKLVASLSSYFKEIYEYSHMLSCLNEVPKPKGKLNVETALKMFNLGKIVLLTKLRLSIRGWPSLSIQIGFRPKNTRKICFFGQSQFF